MTVTLTSPPILTTLLTGLLIAFAFQLLLTSFGIAAGVTAIGYLPNSKSDQKSDPTLQPAASNKPAEPNRGGKVIGFAVGAGTLLTVNSVLFVACFLAIKLSLVSSLVLGAILGLVIWSAYFLVLTWVSSNAVSSLVGSIFGTLASGLQELMTTVMSAISGRKDQSLTDAIREQIASQETTLTTLQREISAALSSDNTQTVQETLKDYLKTLPSPQLDLQAIRDEFADLLNRSSLKTVAADLSSATAPTLDRQILLEVLRDRPDLSKQDANQLVEQLETVWQEATSQNSDPQTAMANFLRDASSEDLQSDRLPDQLAELLPQSLTEQLDLQSLDLKQLTRTVLQRVDLSDLDVSKILGQLHSLVGRSTETPTDLLQADVEDYLLNAYPWQLTRKTVQLEFKEVIYDPEADPAQRQQLERLDREFLTSLLQKRQDLKPAKIAKIVDRLEDTRQEVLAILQAREDEDHKQIRAYTDALWSKLETYTSDLSERLTAKNIQRQIKLFLRESPLDLTDLKRELPQFDRAVIERRLLDRQDLSEKRIQQVIQHLEKAWNSLSVSTTSSTAAKADAKTDAKSSAKVIHQPTTAIAIDSLSKAPRRLALRATEKAKATVQDFQETLTDYLRHTDKEELNPEDIQRDLQLLLRDPKAGWHQLSDRLSHCDRSTLVALLSQRDDLTVEEANQIADRIESNLQRFTEQIQQVQQQAQTTIAQSLTQFRDRLASLELPELDYDHIKQDLHNLLADPQAGIESLGRRLSGFNRDALMEFLKSRDDLSDTIAHQIVDRVDAVRMSVLQQADRLQQETQQRIEDLKQQAQHQAEETRKVVATAAWWLFGIAFTSAITAAIAGALAAKTF